MAEKIQDYWSVTDASRQSTLTFKFDLPLNFKISYNFKFHMCIPYDKAFHMVP